MLRIGDVTARNCRGVSRREILQVAGISTLGLTLADFWRLQAEAANPAKADEARDVSCIFLWLDGGPSHFETFDPKPDTPDAIRGPYGAISTNVAGIQIGELLPMLSRHIDKCAIIRSMTHRNGSHAPIPMMTGFDGESTSYGAVISKLQGFRTVVPPYVHIGSRLGVGGGSLGAPFSPVEVRDPSGKTIAMPQFSLSADISADRFQSRRDLLGSLDALRAGWESTADVAKLDRFTKLAYQMLTSTEVRDAFDLSREPEELRDRYGASFFGQSCLMARRLVEAGTRFVQVKWYDGPAWDGWDVHGADLGGMVRMEQHLCPRLDQGLTALLDDLQQRGMLDRTLVVVVGEFGRTPQINKYGARDHWPNCFSALLAGGGVRGGTIIGASDKQGAAPADKPVGPPDFAATLYKLMGLNVTTDQRLKPFVRGGVPVI